MTLETIVKQGLCVGCGVCISEECHDDSVMHWNNEGFLEPDIICKTDNKNNMRERVCPFSLSNGKELDEDHLAREFLTSSLFIDDEIGSYNSLYAGHSLKHRESSSSGGIATYIFESLLSENYVQHLFVVSEYEGKYAYQLFSNAKEIKQISKTRYYPVTLASLFKEIDKIDGRIAVSGVACFIKAIRLKQHYNPALKEKIPFLVGIICGGLKSRFYTDYLAQSAGCFNLYESPEYRVKNTKSYALDYKFSCINSLSKINHSVDMQPLGDMWGTGLFKAKACDYCDDVATELADISLGDAWIKPYKDDGAGNNIIITRSKLADDLLIAGLNSNALKLDVITLSQIKSSQQGSFNHRHKGLLYRVCKAKKNGINIPIKRSRFLCKQSKMNDIVQFLRSSTRAKSLTFWNEDKSASLFNKNIKPYLFILKKMTKINHGFNRIYKIIGIKK